MLCVLSSVLLVWPADLIVWQCKLQGSGSKLKFKCVWYGFLGVVRGRIYATALVVLMWASWFRIHVWRCLFVSQISYSGDSADEDFVQAPSKE